MTKEGSNGVNQIDVGVKITEVVFGNKNNTG